LAPDVGFELSLLTGAEAAAPTLLPSPGFLGASAILVAEPKDSGGIAGPDFGFSVSALAFSRMAFAASVSDFDIDYSF
jgi:hypothetical protein